MQPSHSQNALWNVLRSGSDSCLSSSGAKATFYAVLLLIRLHIYCQIVEKSFADQHDGEKRSLRDVMLGKGVKRFINVKGRPTKDILNMIS